jgi:hypothetical protein
MTSTFNSFDEKVTSRRLAKPNGQRKKKDGRPVLYAAWAAACSSRQYKVSKVP